MNFSFDPLAAQEFKSAFDYYETQETGLGEKFRQAVWSALTILERYPEAG